MLMVVPSDLGRPRPGVVVQGDKFNAGLSTIFVCPVSSDLQDGLSLRPLIEVAPGNGLRLRSQIMTDKLDDRFHETGIDEPSIHGTRSVLADSSFENG